MVLWRAMRKKWCSPRVAHSTSVFDTCSPDSAPCAIDRTPRSASQSSTDAAESHAGPPLITSASGARIDFMSGSSTAPLNALNFLKDGRRTAKGRAAGSSASGGASGGAALDDRACAEAPAALARFGVAGLARRDDGRPNTASGSGDASTRALRGAEGIPSRGLVTAGGGYAGTSKCAVGYSTSW